MQLKRLEIYGFKSFAEKCVITFPPGISAVVGPNGCGKSNIIDAIKWVMGEQSVRQLRGKSMGDVIFSGTDKKPPVNMAEVSLTISGVSEQASLPASAYSEIMITRRLYRSGESQYLLNKQPCRLKDINDIFLRHGMGSRSCAIIQQGNIGAITDAAPEERRTFIEEAAGVMRYKTRKQEAAAKVSSTRQNLERINDILEEIETQLQTLEAEAAKAKQYREYQQQLRETDFLITAYYYEDYSARIKENNQLLERLWEKDNVSEETIRQLNSALEEIEARRGHREKSIADFKAKKAEIQRSKDRLEAELRHLNDRRDQLLAEVSELEHFLDEAEAKNRKIESEIEQSEKKRADLEETVKALKADLAGKEASTKDDRAKLESVEKQLEKHRKELRELEAGRSAYQNNYHSAKAGKDQIKRRLKELASERQQTEKNIAELGQKEASRQEQRNRLQQKIDEIAGEMETVRETIKVENRKLQQHSQRANELSGLRSKIKSKLGVLNRMQSNLEWYKDGVKAVMKEQQAENSGSISGCLEIVADLIEPEDGYQTAAEAALGDALQYIVVKTRSAGLGALDFLKSNSAGRSGFIPADVEGRQIKTQPGPNGVTALSSRIRTKKGFENIIETLISDIGVAEDIDSALKEIASGTSFRAVATKAGDMVTSSGILIGGSADKMAGILEKKQEIRQLSADLENTENRLNQEKELQKEQESEVRRLENRLARLTEKKYEKDAEIMEADKALYRTAEKLKQAGQRLEVVKLEQERLQGEKEDINKELTEHDTALSQFSEKIDSAENKISELNRQKQMLADAIREFESACSDLKMRITRHSAELENSRQTAERLKEFKEEERRRIDRMHKEIDQKQKEAENAGIQAEETARRLKEEKTAFQDLGRRLKTEQEEFQRLSSRRKETDDNLLRTQDELEKTREKIHRLELDLSGLQINRDNLVNRFLEKYSESFDRIRSLYRDRVISPDFSVESSESSRAEIRRKIDDMGEVNLGAIEAYENQKSRRDFLAGHRDDLNQALEDLENVIQRINRITRKLFTQTFEAINEKFSELFPRLFNGGAAWLELTRPDNPLETGVELMINPPGKKVSRLSLLSGGEKALSAIAFIFAIFLLNPAAFCLLDEIDAPLDDINVERFNELLRIIGEKTQIIMITHNKKTMEFCDMLLGVTMAESGVSRVISVNMEEAVKINPAIDKAEESFA